MLAPSSTPPEEASPEPQQRRGPGRIRRWASEAVTWRRVRRAALGVGVALVALAALAVALHAYLNSEPVRRKLVDRMRSELRARTALVELGDKMSVDWLGRVEVGPLLVRADPGGPAFVEIDSLRVRPRYRALLSGHADVAAVSASGVRVDLGERGRNLLDFVANVRHRAGDGGPAPDHAPTQRHIALDADGVSVRGSVRGPSIAIADGMRLELDFQQSGAGRGGALQVRFADGSSARLEASLDGSGALAAKGALAAVGPSALSGELWRALPVELQGGTIDATLDVSSPDRGHKGHGSASVVGRALVASGERLAARPVGPMSGGFEASWSWDAPQRSAQLERASAWLGEHRDAAVDMSGEVSLGGDGKLRFEARADGVDMQALLAALPPQLRPDDGAPICEGKLSARLAIAGPTLSPEQWEITPKLDVSGLRVSEKAPRLFLLSDFEYKPVDARGNARSLWIGRDSPSFVALAELPEYVVRAVLQSEDAGFYGHQGFEFTELGPTLRAAMKGARVRGASTLTQQLAKNLFLTRERTVARKVKEALITLALEVVVPKDRLLEVYLNVIEWGPNLYGLGEASQYYFGVDAPQLTPLQACFLASIIPSPSRGPFYLAKKEMTPHMDAMVRALIDELYRLDYLDEAQRTEGLTAPLVFRTVVPPTQTGAR